MLLPTLPQLPTLAATPALAGLASRAVAFRAALAPADIWTICLARDVFQAAWIVPLALYLEFEPRPRKWPITISWTIRRGVPKLAHHTCWVLGWLLFVFAASRARDVLVSAFLAQMFVTGFLAVILCPVGVSPLQDKIHWIASLLYIADHAVAFGILGTAPAYVAAFWSCFALMVWATTIKGARERLSETAFMVGEYGLFIAFLSGMGSGLGAGGIGSPAFVPLCGLLLAALAGKGNANTSHAPSDEAEVADYRKS